MKTCTKCDQLKTLKEFSKNKNFADGHSYQCKECSAVDHKWRSRQPERRRAVKNTYLKLQYGITIEQYEEMLIKQRGVCEICGLPERKNHSVYKVPMDLAVDHDHTTGKVRALLCSDCNMLLGRVESRPELMSKVILYARRYGVYNE